MLNTKGNFKYWYVTGIVNGERKQTITNYDSLDSLYDLRQFFGDDPKIYEVTCTQTEKEIEGYNDRH